MGNKLSFVPSVPSSLRLFPTPSPQPPSDTFPLFTLEGVRPFEAFNDTVTAAQNIQSGLGWESLSLSLTLHHFEASSMMVPRPGECHHEECMSTRIRVYVRVLLSAYLEP